MAEPEDIDFEGLGSMMRKIREENPDLIDFMNRNPGVTVAFPKGQYVPQKEPDDIDFEAFGKAKTAASTLATHRWRRLQASSGSEAMPVAGRGAQTYQQLVNPTGTVPGSFEPDTPITTWEQANQTIQNPSSGINNLQLAPGLGINTEPVPPKGPSDSILESLGPQLAPGPSMAGNALKDAAVIGPFGLGLGAADVAQLGARATGNLATGNVARAGELAQPMVDQITNMAQFGAKAPLVTVGAVLSDIHPAINSFLKQYGVSRDDFNQMFHDNPLGTILGVVGGVVGAKAGIEKATGGGPGGPGGSQASIREVESNQQSQRVQEMKDALARNKYNAGPKIQSDLGYQQGVQFAQQPFEQAMAGLRSQLAEGGAPGLIDVTEKGKPAGKGLHGIQAILAEYQLVRPDLDKAQIKSAFANDREAVLRDIAYARAQDAIANHMQQFTDVPGGLEAATAEGVGSQPTVPINRPLDEFPNSRLGEIREATKTVDEYHQRRNPTKGGSPLGMGLGGFGDFEDINKTIQKWYDMGFSFEKSLDIVNDWKQKGIINKEQEKAFIDELDRAETKDLLDQNEPDARQDYQPRPKGPTLGSGLGGAQDFLEKRSWPEQRQMINDLVDNWMKSGITFNQAHDMAEQMKSEGKITGAQESGFKREINHRYMPPLESAVSSGNMPAELTPEELAHERVMSEARAARPPLPREGEEPTQPPPPKDKGFVLGSGLGGGQDFLDLLAKNGLAHIKNGFTDFLSWAKVMRSETTQAGYPITEKELQDIWQRSDLQGSLPKVPPGTSAAASILNGNVKTSATNNVGAANTKIAQHLFANEVGTGPTSLQAMTNAENVLSVIHDVWESDFGTRSGAHEKARRYFPYVNEQATHLITSHAQGFLKTRTHVEAFKAIIGGNKATETRYLHDLADLAEDDRARALESRDNADLAAYRQQLSDARAQALSDAQTASDAHTRNERFNDAEQIASSLSELGPADYDVKKMAEAKRTELLADPKMQRILQYWNEKIAPEIEQMTDNLDIKKRLTGPLGLYTKFRQLDMNEAKRLQRTRPVGTYVPTGEGNYASRVGSPSSQAPWSVRPGYSGSAHMATGKIKPGFAYENDIRYMLENTYRDRIAASAKNDLRQSIRDSSLGSKSTLAGQPVPRSVMVGGRPEAVIPLTLESANGITEDTYYVPATVAETYANAMQAADSSKLRKLWDLGSSAATTQVILLPAEAVRHGFNAISNVMGSRFMYKYGSLAEMGETLLAAGTLGMSKMATAINRAHSLEGPALAELIEQYGKAGGLRLSGYEGTNIQRSAPIRAAEKIPGIRPLKDVVFGDPGSSKGFRGMETRLRIVVGEAIREMEPGITNTELAAKVNDAYGTYVGKLAPELTKLIGPADPFARAGVGLTRSGVKLLRGKDVTGQYSPLVHVQVAGTLAAIAIYNKLLDDEKKWPWEHPDYRFGDIMVLRRGGRTYRESFADLAGPLKRGSEFTGLTSVSNALIRGERNLGVLANEWMRGVRNAVVNRASPLLKAIATLTTGQSLAQAPSGDFYHTVKPSMSGAKGGLIPSRVKEAIGSGVPAASKAFELLKQTFNPESKGPTVLWPSTERTLPNNYLGKVAYDLQDLFSAPYFPIIESEAKSKRMGGELQRRIQQEFNDSTRAIAREAMNVPQEKRMEYIHGEIDKRISNETITILGNPAPAKAAALATVMGIVYHAPAYNMKANVLSDINQPRQ
jgi:hypothetical protein